MNLKKIIAFALILTFVLAMTFVRLPYFAFRPGSVNELSRRIIVSKGESFKPAGEIHFTTIKQDSSINGWEFIQGTFKDSVHLVDESAVLGVRDRDQNRNYNFELMRVSKSTAVAVALTYLGLEPYKATGVGMVSVEGPAKGILTTADVVISVDGEKVFTDEDLIFQIRKNKPGEVIQLGIENIDGSNPRKISIELGKREDNETLAFLGIAPQTRLEDNKDIPIEVSVNTGRVGGNSAGLALTLAVLDVLTPGELTAGLEVATTGTIDLSGNVGPIGGVVQKAITARKAGMDLFLVPESIFEEAIRHSGEDMKVKGVANLQEALEVLTEFGGNGNSLKIPKL